MNLVALPWVDKWVQGSMLYLAEHFHSSEMQSFCYAQALQGDAIDLITLSAGINACEKSEQWHLALACLEHHHKWQLRPVPLQDGIQLKFFEMLVSY